MNRVNSQASRLIELYCEIELGQFDEEPRITKVFPRDYTDSSVLKILPNFAFPHKQKAEK
jgi:hypothetical protein